MNTEATVVPTTQNARCAAQVRWAGLVLTALGLTAVALFSRPLWAYLWFMVCGGIGLVVGGTWVALRERAKAPDRLRGCP